MEKTCIEKYMEIRKKECCSQAMVQKVLHSEGVDL